MEVYEVMFFAMPLWFGLVAFIFTLVFGRDVVAYFKSKGATTEPVIRPKKEAAPASNEHHEPYPYEDAVRKGERELVLR